jgi:hypothetical protein
MILSPIRLAAGRRKSFRGSVFLNHSKMRSPGRKCFASNLYMLHEPAKSGLKPMLGSLPCLSTMREESAFGYMTKVMLVPWSTTRAVRSGS